MPRPPQIPFVGTTCLIAVIVGALAVVTCSAQSPATIRAERTSILTYPFSGPDRVPMLVKDDRLYPYHAFTGLTNEPVNRDWNVVILENDFIVVYVLPEAGGKVWGAIEKATGEEFIYRNEVMKFRNIALRGPWTSGGIEFNFGVIGHTPSTASPVDYEIVENDDGSVSCFVGAMDLPSRTQWRVEIRLAHDKAFFETRTTWYNPTPIEQPYYNWMTAAAFATNDLVLSIPGDKYLQHGGAALPWPVDAAGRTLSVYANNTFEGHKSYHVVGSYDDFFGGYYRDQGYGFGHWAEYGDMPGQKLWLWALSRQGGIWENLLTDTDGQYVEFQAGRLFVQYSPGRDANPITQVGFEPYRTDRWIERWFPVVGIGGLTDASADAAMGVVQEGRKLRIGINPFGYGTATLTVSQSDRIFFERHLDLSPMANLVANVDLPDDEPFVVSVDDLDLIYRSDAKPIEDSRRISRPFAQDSSARRSIPEVERQYFAGRELMKARRHTKAREVLESVLMAEPWHEGALLAVAELEYRSARYAAGLELIDRVRQIDAYHPGANYQAGVLHRALGNRVDAIESFGWAARSMAYRSAALAQLAELELIDGAFASAQELAKQALDYDRYSVNALETLAIANRRMGDASSHSTSLKLLRDVDRLSHLANFEAYVAEPDSRRAAELLDAFESAIRSEFADQSYVELALSYDGRGQRENAIRLMELAAANTGSQIAEIWLAFLNGETFSARDVTARPYRRETIAALEWVAARRDDWRVRFLLALNYWATGRLHEAAELMATLGGEPDDPAVYISRATLLHQTRAIDPEDDLQRALTVDDTDPQTWLHLSRFYETRGRWVEALELARRMFVRFPDDFVVRLALARSLLHNEEPLPAIEVLKTTYVLPAEGAGDGRTIHSQANTMAGIQLIEAGAIAEALPYLRTALAWPERLGQGRPYEPDDRLQNFLISWVEAQLAGTDSSRIEDMFADARVHFGELLRAVPPVLSGIPRMLVERSLTATGN